MSLQPDRSFSSWLVAPHIKVLTAWWPLLQCFQCFLNFTALCLINHSTKTSWFDKQPDNVFNPWWTLWQCLRCLMNPSDSIFISWGTFYQGPNDSMKLSRSTQCLHNVMKTKSLMSLHCLINLWTTSSRLDKLLDNVLTAWWIHQTKSLFFEEPFIKVQMTWCCFPGLCSTFTMSWKQKSSLPN